MRLGVLQDNGGATFTRALGSGSFAIDQGDSFGLSTDQRGFLRGLDSPQNTTTTGGDGTDIGAFELNPFQGSGLDTDGDGMPDDFETFYGVTDPNADDDGDGRTNLQEFRDGTDPRNDSSFLLKILAIERSGSDIVVRFSGVAGKTFRLERTLDLANPASSFERISGVPDRTPDITGPTEIIDPGAVGLGKAFYRMRLCAGDCE